MENRLMNIAINGNIEAVLDLFCYPGSPPRWNLRGNSAETNFLKVSHFKTTPAVIWYHNTRYFRKNIIKMM